MRVQNLVIVSPVIILNERPYRIRVLPIITSSKSCLMLLQSLEVRSDFLDMNDISHTLLERC